MKILLGTLDQDLEEIMLDDLEKKIASELDHAIIEDDQTRGSSSEKWVRRMKERLCEMGHREGFRVSADKCDGADTGEWLFDLVWSEQHTDPDRFIRMPLVMECEWDPSLKAIIWNFEKLLVAKAPFKLMVFQQATPENVQNIMTILEDRVRYFVSKLPKERYLLAGYAYDQRVYVYETV